MKKTHFQYLCLIIVGAFFLSVSCGAQKNPTSVLSEFLSATKAKDGTKAWSLLSSDTQRNYEKIALEKLKAEFRKFPENTRKNVKDPGTGETADKVLSMNAQQYFCLRVEKGPDDPKLKNLDTKKLPVEKETIKDDAALVVVKDLGDFAFVREGGLWKLTITF